MSLGQSLTPVISTLCLFTHERPETLKTCLDSYLAHFKKFGHSVRIAVYDDSRSEAACERNKGVVAALCAAYGAEGVYRDREWKRRSFAAMSRYLPAKARESTEFLLFGKEPWNIPAGANFNWALLEHAGERVLFSDDDLVCNPSWSPNRSDGIALSQVYDPTEFRFFRDRQDAVKSTVFTAIDVLSEHEALLSKSLRTMRASSKQHATGCSEDSLALEGLGPAAEIGLVMGGIVGDSGLDSPLFLLTLDGDSRDSLINAIKDKKIPVPALRELHRCVRRPTVTDGSFLMTNTFSIDNIGPVPPFFPVERGVDATFAWTYRKVYGSRLIAYLPFALCHFPDSKPPYPQDAISMKRLDLCAIMLGQIAACSLNPSAGKTAEHFAALGSHFRDFSSKSAGVLREELAAMNRGFCEGNISDIEEYLERYGRQPIEWARPLDEAMSDLQATLKRPEVLSFNFLKALETDAVIGHISEAFRLFGEGLEAWMAIGRAYRASAAT